MNFSRKMDELCHSLALSQARIFERSIEDGIPSYFFIRSYMTSNEVRFVDELDLERSGLNELEIYESIKNRIKTRNGELLPYPVMHFIGYFYRSAAYLTKLNSKYLFENISPKYLLTNYETLHSLPIEEAIKEAIEIFKLETKSKEELFVEIYKTIK